MLNQGEGKHGRARPSDSRSGNVVACSELRFVFEWHTAKAASNLSKHGVEFERRQRYSPIRSRGSSMIPIIQARKHARSSSGIRLRNGCWWYPSWGDGIRFGLSARGKRRGTNAGIMKKTSRRKLRRIAADDLRREYRFDYQRSRPNRFASRIRAGSIAVVLEPDVASVFRSSEDVNAFLRSVIAAVPSALRSSRSRVRKAG